MNINNEKKIARITTFLLGCSIFILLNSCNPKNNNSEIPFVFREFISETEIPIEYKKACLYHGENRLSIPGFLTKKQALEDIEILCKRELIRLVMQDGKHISAEFF